MKLIIDISDCDYEYIRNNCIVPIKYDNHIYEAIRSGTPYEKRLKDEWIPVSERLPKYSGLYLISIDGFVTVANFIGTYFSSRGGNRVEVDAWQSLPKPYKETD